MVYSKIFLSKLKKVVVQIEKESIKTRVSYTVAHEVCPGRNPYEDGFITGYIGFEQKQGVLR